MLHWSHHHQCNVTDCEQRRGRGAIRKIVETRHSRCRGARRRLDCVGLARAQQPGLGERRTAPRIDEAVQSVGYIPHAPARALSSRRTRTLGAIVPTIDNTMFARGIASLQKYLSSVGYMLLLTTSGYDLDAELEQARNLVSRGVDGLVLRGDCHHDALRKLLADNAVPFVNVGVYQPDRPYPCVGTDNEAAAYRAAAACRRTRPPPDRDGVGAAAQQRSRQRPRRRLSPRARRTAARAAPQWHVEVPYTLDDAREAARYLLTSNDRPTAVVCGNDVIAYGVLLEAERSGLSVPRDLSVVGFRRSRLEPASAAEPDHDPRADRRGLAARRRISGQAARRRADHHASRGRLFARSFGDSTAPPRA